MEECPDETVPKGTVIAQYPEPGSTQKAGTEITAAVSTGPEEKIEKETKAPAATEPSVPRTEEPAETKEPAAPSSEATTESEPTETEPAEPSEPEVDDAESKAVYYSTNGEDTVKNGNEGVYAYIKKGSQYDQYYVIDLDEGYTYYFTDGNGEETCEKVEIESGDLNTSVVITYHDGGDEWSYSLRFKAKNAPGVMILKDNDGFEYEFTP